MAPISPDNTGRIYVDYLVGGEEHTVVARWLTGIGPVTALSTMAEVFAFLDPVLYTTAILGARYSVEGSNVTLPITWPGDPSYGAADPSPGKEMLFISMTGKSTLGRRWRIEFFGINITVPAAWRMPLGVNASLDDAREHISTALATGGWVGIDGNGVLVNPYYNFKYADHEIGKARGG